MREVQVTTGAFVAKVTTWTIKRDLKRDVKSAEKHARGESVFLCLGSDTPEYGCVRTVIKNMPIHVLAVEKAEAV